MANPLKWKRLYQITLLAFVAIGVMGGVACGYHFSGWTWGGVGCWVIKRTDDAVGWATLGGLVAGMVVYGALAISWRNRTRGTAGAAQGRPRDRTPPTRAEAASSTSSRRRKESAVRVSLQQALQGAASA